MKKVLPFGQGEAFWGFRPENLHQEQPTAFYPIVQCSASDLHGKASHKALQDFLCKLTWRDYLVDGLPPVALVFQAESRLAFAQMLLQRVSVNNFFLRSGCRYCSASSCGINFIPSSTINCLIFSVSFCRRRHSGSGMTRSPGAWMKRPSGPRTP